MSYLLTARNGSVFLLGSCQVLVVQSFAFSFRLSKVGFEQQNTDWSVSLLTKPNQQNQRCKRATVKLVGKHSTEHAKNRFQPRTPLLIWPILITFHQAEHILVPMLCCMFLRIMKQYIGHSREDAKSNDTNATFMSRIHNASKRVEDSCERMDSQEYENRPCDGHESLLSRWSIQYRNFGPISVSRRYHFLVLESWMALTDADQGRRGHSFGETRCESKIARSRQKHTITLTSISIPPRERKWIDIGTQRSQKQKCFPVSKAITRLLRHDQTVPRGSDGAIHYSDIIEECRKKKFDGASQWLLND